MTTLGRYEILEKLGTGSMGTVYRARDSVLDREVALKTILTGVDVEPELRERFYREARACARLQHPSIIAVYDLGEADRTAFIAMELLTGSDFRKLIEQRVDLPLDVKVEAMAQVLEALAHAHRRGIIHRDIKPSNLFLTEDQRAKVLDFGIARLPSSHLTVAGKILGTPNYMAPEQILAKPADSRSDLFSAAVVFFEFLVHVHPFQEQLIPRRIVEGEPESLFTYDSKLPIVLDRILARALVKDPAKRYRTGDEFANDLRTLLDALRQNASPTFSRLQLPSERDIHPIAAAAEVVKQQPEAEKSVLSEPPPGEDPYEWRLSEVLRLIPEFEGALDRRDVVAARRALAQLAGIEAVDSRFSEALQLCRRQIEAIEPAPRPAPPPRPTPVEMGTTSKFCAQCGTSNRSAALYCIKCGGDFKPLKSKPVLPAPSPGPPVRPLEPPGPSNPLDQTFPHLTIPGPPLRPPDPGPSRQPPPKVPDKPRDPQEVRKDPPPVRKSFWQAWSPQQQQIALVVLGASLVMVLAIFFVWLTRPVKQERPVATAAIQPARAFLYSDQEGDSRLKTLNRGDRVNILKKPRGADQDRVPAQSLEHRATRAGWVRVRDLDPDSWVGVNADSSLELIRMFHRGEAGTDEELTTELGLLQGLITRYPGTQASREAAKEMARLQIARARRMKDAGQSAEEWASLVASARENLNAAGGDAEIEKTIAQMLAVEKPPPPPPPKPVVVVPKPAGPSQADIDRDLNEADRLRNLEGDLQEQRSNLNRAAQLVEKVLREQPANPRAADLKKKIEQAKLLL